MGPTTKHKKMILFVFVWVGFLFNLLNPFFVDCQETPANSQTVKIKILDFNIKSTNPEHKLIGKGLAALIMNKASKSKDIVFINNRSVMEIIEERKLILMEETTKEETNKLQSSNWIMSGSIFDLFGKINISYKIFSSVTGASVIENAFPDSLANYEYVTACIAEQTIKTFKYETPKEIMAMLGNKDGKPAEYLIKISKAIDLYDNKEYENAKIIFEEIIKLDQNDDLVQSFIDKINKKPIKTGKKRHSAD